jgi:hypothetical protein
MNEMENDKSVAHQRCGTRSEIKKSLKRFLRSSPQPKTPTPANNSGKSGAEKKGCMELNIGLTQGLRN